MRKITRVQPKSIIDKNHQDKASSNEGSSSSDSKKSRNHVINTDNSESTTFEGKFLQQQYRVNVTTFGDSVSTANM